MDTAPATGPALRPGPGWLDNAAQLDADPAVQRGRRWLLAVLAIYAAVTLLAIPHGIGSSWRECDTQAIARNFLSEGFNPMRPRVDWRGTTDGAVECEFPLYQLMTATVMGAVGEAEWPGRMLSLLSMLIATLSLHRLLEARAGPAGALMGAMVFLCGRNAMVLGTSVMPDATSTALALAGLATYVRYLATGSGVSLLLAAVATTFGALTKPTALQSGLLLFLWAATLAPRRLREPRLWVALASIVGVVALWLWHGHTLYEETGLTFGVISGGDTKFPDVEHLLMPELHWQMLMTTGRYGLGPLGLLGLGALIVRRQFDRADACVLLTIATGLFVSFRYSHSSGLGRHYHIFAAVAGAWFAARALPRQPGKSLWAALIAAVIALGALFAFEERHWRQNVLAARMLPLARAVQDASESDELIVVHGHEPTIDPSWNRRYNFEEPMVLYNARRRGWVLARDGVSLEALTGLHERGARLYVDQQPGLTPEPARRWLEQRARLVATLPGGAIYRLPEPAKAGDPARNGR